MPSHATFDYYAELCVNKSATHEQITSSFRRLALVHHPDRNPGDVDAATAKFQRINEAYETLGDPGKRLQYDRSLIIGNNSDDEFADFGDPSDDDDVDSFIFIIGGIAFRVPHRPHQPRAPPTYDEWEREFLREVRLASALEAERRRRAAEKAEESRAAAAAAAAAAQAERIAKAEAKRTARQAREQAEAKAAAKKVEDEEKRQDAEKKKQEAFWEKAKAVTPKEKQETCVHVSFWPKIPGKQKFNCQGCGLKRGPTGFKCPHCGIMVCQGCQIKSSEKKGMMDRTN
ncbi:DnaJ domain-containing protein [Xylariales sp. AK1849]|nr:DnaJ domain-containing protein [Xylariales sp. AK1849]